VDAGVVEEGVAGVAECQQLVLQPRRLHSSLRCRKGCGDARVPPSIDAEYGGPRALKVAAFRERPVERDGRGNTRTT
jgi:hypothetical protein